MKRHVTSYRQRVVDAELDMLLGELPAILLEGARAVGKTTTAARRATTTFRLDEPGTRAVLEADPGVLSTAPGPVLVDEWQFVPAIWDRVRREVDEGAPPGRYLLTGSASPTPRGSHTGAGRIVSLRMRPLSLVERVDDPPTVSLKALLTGERAPVSGTTSLTLIDYAEEILRSGFPGVRRLTGRALRAQLDGYLERVVDRDVEELGEAVRNPTALRRWLRAYAAATGTTASLETIREAAAAGEGHPPAKTTVLGYRDALQRLFILDPLPAWTPSGRAIARLSHPPKHHLADPALAARLVGATRGSLLRGESPGPPIPRDGPLLGALFESLVTLSVRVYAQAAEAAVGHFRTHGGEHEVDLIVERDDGGIVAVEVKLGQAPNERAVRELRWLAGRVGDTLLDAVVVTTGSHAYRRADGIAVVPAALLGP
ncbi:hypothetical protein HRbin12_01146 [bacterium HR12]|nr:hypothetical protein HRbin12_01146 [bacterium HR12]